MKMIKFTDEDLAKMTAFQNKYNGKKNHKSYPYTHPIIYQAQRYALGDDYVRVLITGTRVFSENYDNYNDERMQKMMLFALKHKVNFNLLNRLPRDFKYILFDNRPNVYGVNHVDREQFKAYRVLQSSDVLNVCQLIKGLNVRHSLTDIKIGYCGKKKPFLISAEYDEEFELNALIGTWEMN